MPREGADRTRDAERSREAILTAAETLFAQHGFAGASLGDIAAAAGLSRATPSYFFGSKEGLHLAVIERCFAARETATAAAFAPVRDWCAAADPDRLEGLAEALGAAVSGYLEFLLARPTFVTLVMREELAGAATLRARRTTSTAVTDAFTQLAAVTRTAPEQPPAFAVEDAVLLFISLCFTPLALSASFLPALGRDLRDPATRRAHVELAVGQLMHLIRG